MKETHSRVSLLMPRRTLYFSDSTLVPNMESPEC